MDKKIKLKVRVISPEKIIWEGDAFSVSSRNSQGKFDILPRHTGFLTIIENQPIRIGDGKKVIQEFRFKQALIYNRRGQVSIYTLGQKTEDGGQKTGSKTENRSGKIPLQSSDIDPPFCFLSSVF